MEKDLSEKFNIKRAALPIIFAIALIAVPVYWAFARPTEFLSLEKRYRGKVPAISLKALADGSWTSAVETWMADKMPARDFFMGVNAYWQCFTGRQSAQEIYRDSRGMLVEAPFPSDEAGLNTRLDVIKRFADGMARDFGARTVLLVSPTAGYSEGRFLPERVRSGFDDDVFFAAVKERLGDSARLLDLLGAFVRTPEQEPLFYRTDHHWNAQGAYCVYAALCGELGIEPQPQSAFERQSYDGFYGSTFSRSGLWLTAPDSIELWQPLCDVRVTFSDADAEYESLFFADHLSEADKYPVFLDGNHPLTTVENTSTDDGDTLLMVKDSYANSLIPLLIGSCKRIILVDLRYYRQGVGDIVSNNKIRDIVIVYSREHIISDPDILFLR